MLMELICLGHRCWSCAMALGIEIGLEEMGGIR